MVLKLLIVVHVSLLTLQSRPFVLPLDLLVIFQYLLVQVEVEGVEEVVVVEVVLEFLVY
jgi:hypothetical protein